MSVRVGQPWRPRVTVEGGETRALKYYHYYSQNVVIIIYKVHVDISGCYGTINRIKQFDLELINSFKGFDCRILTFCSRYGKIDSAISNYEIGYRDFPRE